jgi:putative phosphoesterase
MPRALEVLGVISDTHGLLRPEAVAALSGCSRIIHAGDIGKRDILDALAGIAPVIAVRGNVDTAPWASALPETAVAEVGTRRIFILHDIHQLGKEASGLAMVITGHSHRHSFSERGGVLYLNPGSAGPRRFRLPITLARIDVRNWPWHVEIVRLDPTRSVEPQSGRGGRL